MSDLKINTKFAEKYEKYRQKEELQRRKLFHLTLETRARAVNYTLKYDQSAFE